MLCSLCCSDGRSFRTFLNTWSPTSSHPRHAEHLCVLSWSLLCSFGSGSLAWVKACCTCCTSKTAEAKGLKETKPGAAMWVRAPTLPLQPRPLTTRLRFRQAVFGTRQLWGLSSHMILTNLVNLKQRSMKYIICQGSIASSICVGHTSCLEARGQAYRDKVVEQMDLDLDWTSCCVTSLWPPDHASAQTSF